MMTVLETQSDEGMYLREVVEWHQMPFESPDGPLRSTSWSLFGRGMLTLQVKQTVGWIGPEDLYNLKR